MPVQKVLAIVALFCAILSFVVAGAVPWLALAVIALALAFLL